MSPESAPDGSIIITPKEFYDGVRKDVEAIKDSITRVETAVSPLPQRIDKLEARADKADERIDVLNVKIAWFCGAGTAIGALIGALVPYFFG